MISIIRNILSALTSLLQALLSILCFQLQLDLTRCLLLSIGSPVVCICLVAGEYSRESNSSPKKLDMIIDHLYWAVAVIYIIGIIYAETGAK